MVYTHEQEATFPPSNSCFQFAKDIIMISIVCFYWEAGAGGRIHPLHFQTQVCMLKVSSQAHCLLWTAYPPTLWHGEVRDRRLAQEWKPVYVNHFIKGSFFWHHDIKVPWKKNLEVQSQEAHPRRKCSISNSSWLPQTPPSISPGCFKHRIWQCFAIYLSIDHLYITCYLFKTKWMTIMDPKSIKHILAFLPTIFIIHSWLSIF